MDIKSEEEETRERREKEEREERKEEDTISEFQFQEVQEDGKMKQLWCEVQETTKIAGRNLKRAFSREVLVKQMVRKSSLLLANVSFYIVSRFIFFTSFSLLHFLYLSIYPKFIFQCFSLLSLEIPNPYVNRIMKLT